MGIFDAAASLINNAVNTSVQARANNKNIEFQRETNQQNIGFQREINDTNYQRQLDMWNMTNEYNHPAQQMQRYKDAGLNPNLIYGQSNTAQSANVGTAQATKVDAPSVQPYLNQRATIGNVMEDFLAIQHRKEQVESLKLDNDLKRKTLNDQITIIQEKAKQSAYDTTFKQLQNDSLSIDNALKEIQREVDEYSKENRKTLSDLSVDKENQEISNLVKSGGKIDVETDYYTKLGNKLSEEIPLIKAQASLMAVEEALKTSQKDLTEEQKKVYQEQVAKLNTEIKKIKQDMGIGIAEHQLDRLQQLLEMYMNANQSWQFEGGLYLQKEFKNLLKEIFPDNDYRTTGEKITDWIKGND